MGRADFKSFNVVDFAFRNSKGKVKAAPELPEGVRVADTHCHLNMLDDPALAIARAAHYGVRFLCCITDPADRPRDDEQDAALLSACESYAALDAWLDGARRVLDGLGEPDTPLPDIRFACGVHPHNARLWDEAHEQLCELLADARTCCLGEIGLDYHYDFSPRDVQREVFAAQLRIAHERALPVSLHLREAHADALEVLEREGVPAAGCILHCFNLDVATLEPFLDLGCHIAFGGSLTFRKGWYTRLASLAVPAQRLLTETDAPYMAPEPLRGTVCEPAQTVFTLRMLLDCFGYGGEERARELTAPRQQDLDAGARPPAPWTRPDTGAMSEAQLAEQVYRNALGLLGGVPSG